jgi:hypothetical protein
MRPRPHEAYTPIAGRPSTGDVQGEIVSASIQPAHPSSSWRPVIVGAVAVLAVGIGVAAGSFMLTSRGSGLGAAAGYVPADAPFYVELELEPSAAQDAALRELLGRFPPIEGLDLDRPLHDQLVETIDEAIAGGDVELSWAEDVAPWFDGRVALAVTEIDPEALADPARMATAEPDVLIVAGVTDATAARATAERLVAEAGSSDATESEYRGVTIVAGGDAEMGAYAVTDDALLVAASADVIRAAIDRDAEGGSLATADGTGDLVGRLPDDRLVLGIYDLEELVVASLEASADASGIPQDAFAALIEDQPMRGAFAISAAGDRLAFDAVTDAPTGPFAVSNEARALAEDIPGDAFYYAEAGNLGAGVAAMVEVFKEAAATDPKAAEELRTFEAALGTEVEDFVGWIGDAALSAGWDGSEAYLGVVVIPTDLDDARQRLEQLAGFARLATLDPSSGLTVEDSDVAGTEVTTIRWEDPTMVPDPTVPVPTGIAVEFAVTDDRVVIGLGDRFVARSLELDPSDSLAANDRYASTIDAFGGEDHAGAVWVDLALLRESLESALGPTAEAFGVPYATEVQPWLEPLDRIVVVNRLDGDLLVQRGALLVD